MTRERTVDERISAWLLEEAPDQLPDRVLQATFERTRPSRQRRAWLRRRPFSMIRVTPPESTTGVVIPLVIVVATLVIAVGVALLPQSNTSVGAGLGPSPSITPSASATDRLTPDPSLTPIALTGQVAFERTVDGNTDIYLMNLDRTGLVRLTDDPAVDVNPGWSPDGRQILFRRVVDRAGDLYVANADGSDPRRLTESTENEYDGRFSPDGRTIAFWRSDDAATELRLMDRDGSNDRPVVRFEATFTAGVNWTADGQAILFNKGEAGGAGIDIVRIDLDSMALTQVTTTPERDGSFALSRDGTTIAFQSDRLPAGIYLMGVDGSNIRHLTGSQATGYPVSWSPDGEHLVRSQPDGWLYLVRTDASETIRWTPGGLEVAWRPGS